MPGNLKEIIDQYKNMDLDGKVLEGTELRKVLNDMINYNLYCFAENIKRYAKVNLFDMAGRMIRGIEEFINIILEIDTNQKINNYDKIVYFPAVSLKVKKIKELERLFSNNYDDLKLISRLMNIYLQLVVLNITFANIDHSLNFTTLGEAICYLQSRRAYLSTFQSLILKYCEGDEIIDSQEMLAVFIPAMECYLLPAGNTADAITLSYCLDDFSVTFRGRFPNLTCDMNYEHKTLEDFFLQPIRIPLTEVIKYLPHRKMDPALGKKEKNKILSFGENLLLLKHLRIAFSEFGLDKYILFDKYLTLYMSLKKYLLHDYYFVISRNDLSLELKKIFGTANFDGVYKSLFIPQGTFQEILNSHNPFVSLGDNLYSNINLYLRFLHYLAEEYLNTIKKYQIKSGFVFEKMIVEILIEYNFDVKDVKRLENEQETYSEFDVIAVKNEIIYNFQCKNNYLDISNIKTDNSEFKKLNDSLIRKYNVAYEKEIERQEIIKNKLGINRIRHIVVSRFPVITREQHIVTYQNFKAWIKDEIKLIFLINR